MLKKKSLLWYVITALVSFALGIGIGIWIGRSSAGTTEPGGILDNMMDDIQNVIQGVTQKPDKQDPNNSNATNGDTATYKIEVKSASGIPLKDVGLYIYEDSSLQELVAFLKTDEAGAAEFTDVPRDTYVAVLDKVPTGYEAKTYYPISGALTEIVLETGKMDEADVETLTYKLGDAVMDFSVTAPDGKTYTLSELFKGKKAMVLNFFYNACQPCMLEFPYLQEAYAEYSDSIGVLAMNPVDGDDASIAALQKELGITFPMVKCGPEWEKIMQLTAYPTTVIIDRFGNICLIHGGSVTEAKIFKDAFAYFAADNYEQKMIAKIEDLRIEEPEGTEENPVEISGQNKFEVTVPAGQVVYNDLYKVFNMYMQIASKNAYVIYNGETYYPKNGVIGLMVSSPDTFTPATIGFGNSGTSEETFTVYLSSLAGTFDNPYTMSLGEFDASVAAGNEQGVYYTYVTPGDGTLTLQCLSATPGVKYGFYLYNTVTSAMRNLDSDGKTAEDGTTSVSVDAKKGQKIQICISTLPDSNNAYPAGQFKFLATFEEGEVDLPVVETKSDYTVTVLDDAQQPVANVSIIVNIAGQRKGYTTDASGKVSLSLTPGTYSGEMYVPDGYSAQTTTFTLSDAAPNAKLVLDKIKTADYTVKVVGPKGEAVSGVFVKIGEGDWLTTDTNGTVSQNLNVADYAVTIVVPSGYAGETAHKFAQGATELTITLAYPEGSEEKPYQVSSYPYETVKLSKNKEVFCSFTYSSEMIGLVIRDADAYIRSGDTTYTADTNGEVRYIFGANTESPVTLAVGNNGSKREAYKVEALFETGTETNPIPVTSYPWQVSIEAGKEYYYAVPVEEGATGFAIRNTAAYVFYGEDLYTADDSGVVKFYFEDGATGTVTLIIGNESEQNKTFTLEKLVAGGSDTPATTPSAPTTPEPTTTQPTTPEPTTSEPTTPEPTTPEPTTPEPTTPEPTTPEPTTPEPTTPEPTTPEPTTPEPTTPEPTIPEPTVPDEEAPEGSASNPKLLTSMGNLALLKLTEGDADGYHYIYTTDKSGTMTLRLLQAVSVGHDVHLTTESGRSALMSESGVSRQVSIDMMQGETVHIHVYAKADPQTGVIPAVNFRMRTSFVAGTVAPPTTDPTVPSVPSDPTAPTVTQPTTPPTTAPTEPEEYLYTVKVTDIFGGGIENIGVLFLLNGAPVETAETDKDGIAELYTEQLNSYTVELSFSGKSYYYDKTAAVLTPSSRNLTIKLTANVDTTDFAEIYILEGNPAYTLYTGGTRVELGTGKPNFSAEYGNNCFFVFTPQEAGTYQITVTPTVELSFWGTSIFINQQTEQVKDNTITFSISGSTVKNVMYVIGIKGDSAVTNAVVNVARIGEPEFSIADQPWAEWKTGLTHTDAWKAEVGLTAVGETHYTLSTTPTYVDITAASGTYNLYYDEANGYYRLSKDGPIVLVDLNATGRFVPLYERVNGNGQYGGSAVTKYFFDSTGKFLRKEAYTEYLMECFDAVKLDSIKETGYYPLTKDFMYVLQNGFEQWWDAESPNYLDGFATANQEYAWMFACCYIPE